MINITYRNAPTGKIVSMVAFSLTGNVRCNVVGKTSEQYKGEYTVTPRPYEQVLKTKNLSMSKDVTVEKISYSTVSNPYDGYTINIGG